MFVDVDETTGTWYAWENERKARSGNFHAPRGSGDTPNEARENLQFILDAADRRQEMEFKLCYVEGNFAYFTTQELSKQWGDDWNDAPYEHNAGTPYTPCWHRQNGDDCQCDNCKRDWNEDGTPKWAIKKIAFEGPFVQPSDNHYNSPYSVEMINNGGVAWLRTDEWTKDFVAIQAGATLQEFINTVKRVGGEVYLPQPTA